MITLQTWVTLGVTISVSEPASSVNLRNSWRRRRSIGRKEEGEWVLEGDSNTAFFHKSANGRKRKSTIHSLEDEGVSFSGQTELREHITKYYKKLFGGRRDS